MKSKKLSERCIRYKMFDPKQIEKLAEYYCDLVNCSFYPDLSLNLKKIAFVRRMFKKRQWFRYFELMPALEQYIVFVQSNGVCLPTAITEAI